MPLRFKLLPVILVCSLLACKKTSTFTGKITNSADGQPVEGAVVRLRFLKGKNGGGTEVVAKEVQTTGANGEYALEVEGKNAEIAQLDVEKEAYAPLQYRSFDPGDCGEEDFVLNPFDAWLSVTFENQSDSEERDFYFNYTGPFYYDKIQCVDACGPFKTLPQAGRTEVMRVPGGEEITINWDTQKTGNTQFSNRKIIFCPRNDTTYVTIYF